MQKDKFSIDAINAGGYVQRSADNHPQVAYNTEDTPKKIDIFDKNASTHGYAATNIMTQSGLIS